MLLGRWYLTLWRFPSIWLPLPSFLTLFDRQPPQVSIRLPYHLYLFFLLGDPRLVESETGVVLEVPNYSWIGYVRDWSWDWPLLVVGEVLDALFASLQQERVELDHRWFVLTHLIKIVIPPHHRVQISRVFFILLRSILILAHILMDVLLSIESERVGVVSSLDHVNLVSKRLWIVSTLAALLVPLLVNIL